MIMQLLPERTADAAGNMAVDFLLLRRHPAADAIRFRHYEWRRPAFTFGYGQEVEFVRREMADRGEGMDHTRRATGGGLVDHTKDWTYALVLPRSHAMWERGGPTVYQGVHRVLSAALNGCGAETRLQSTKSAAAPGVCFIRAEIDDVVNVRTGEKVAGAAMKRAKEGILLQGSIWRPASPEVDWERFASLFPQRLAESLEAESAETGWPDFDPDEEEALIGQYASPEWIERR